ncbi:MAG: GntR family transcriptional regulator [Lachnospirales bacterium]
MFSLNQNSYIPINKQLYTILKKYIIIGVFEEGYKLPSVRELAKELTINPNTVHKVYQELASDGLVDNIPQSGLFVKEVPEKLYNDYLKELQIDFKKSYKDLLDIGLTKNEILKIIDEGVEDLC